MEATLRRRTSRSLNDFWGMVKDMDDSQKLELVTMLIESVKPSVAHSPMRRYTMDEINAMIDASEADIAAGRTISHEEMMHKWEEEIKREEQAELEIMEVV